MKSSIAKLKLGAINAKITINQAQFSVYQDIYFFILLLFPLTSVQTSIV